MTDGSSEASAKEDPKAAKDVADEHPELVAEMSAKFEDYKRSGRSAAR